MKRNEVKKIEVVAKDKVKKQRPGTITVICIIGFLGALFAIPLVFSTQAQDIGAWYPPYLAVSSIIGFISMVGLWTMKKWGAILYASFAGINQVVMLIMGIWTTGALIIPGVIVFLTMSHIKDME